MFRHTSAPVDRTLWTGVPQCTLEPPFLTTGPETCEPHLLAATPHCTKKMRTACARPKRVRRSSGRSAPWAGTSFGTCCSS